MTIRLDPKRPDEKRLLAHDWSAFLGEDTIASQTTTSTGVTITGDDISTDGKSVNFQVSGGTDGTTALVNMAIVTASGGRETETFEITVRNADEPVSLAEAKCQLRIVDEDSEDALIMSYIRSARAFFERETGYVFVRRQFLESFSSWPSVIRIGRQPLVSVDSIEYRDSEGTPQTFTDFVAALDLRRIAPAQVWPQLGQGGTIAVRYTAGFDVGEQADEVEIARQAILTLITHWFLNREAVSVERVTPAEVPYTITALIERIRSMTV